MSTTSDHVIDRSGKPRRRGALADGVLILLSPVLFPIEVFVGIFPVLIVVWAVGAILLWASRAWTAGQKLIGTFLSGASFFSIMVVRVESAEPVGTGAAIAILMMVLLLIATPGIVGVLYLSRRMRRPAPHDELVAVASRRPGSHELAVDDTLGFDEPPK